MLKKWKQFTIKTKIMLLYSALSAVLLAILIPTVYFIVIGTLEETLDTDMTESAQNVISCLYEEGQTVYADEDSITPDMINSGVYIRVVDEDGNVIYSSADAQWAFEVASEYESEEDFKKEWDYFSRESIIGGTTVNIYVLGSIYYNSFVEDMAWILLAVGVVFFFISALGSRFIVKRALWPVRRITQTAASFSVNDPSKRIEGIESKDEVGELADTFNVMLDDLETAFQRERQFTSDVSHELRTPLTVIETCADDALSTQDPEIIKDNLNIIKKENNRMAKMISQLLFLSRGYEGRLNFEPEDFCLYDMAESVTQVLGSKAEEKNITIHNDIPKDLMIFADQSMFIQLFVNLAENAVKYGNEGGNVYLEAIDRGNTTRILISDDGIGISPENLEHIFERFYRADQARDRSGQGLGLSIAKQIVDLHDGKIFAASEVGKGTTFCVEI